MQTVPAISDAGLPTKSVRERRPSKDKVLSRESRRLLKILRHEELSNCFREFLEGSRCVENFFFWKEVEKYKSEFLEWNKIQERKDESDLPTISESDISNESGSSDSGGENLNVGYEKEVRAFIKKNKARIRDIAEIYLEEKSPYRIQIDPKVVTKIKKSLDASDEDFKPRERLFNTAQKTIFTAMREDSLSKFLQSQQFSEFSKNHSPDAAVLKKSGEKESEPKTRSNSGSGGVIQLWKGFGFGKKNPPPEKNTKMQEPQNFVDPKPTVAPTSMSDEEATKARVFVEGCVDRLLGVQSASGKGHAYPNEEDIDHLHKIFVTDAGRKYFAFALNQRRSGSAITNAAFEILWRLIKVALIQADIQNDYTTAKLLMHMSSTFFRTTEGINEYVASKLKSIEIWKKPRFWDNCFYETVNQEREKTALQKPFEECSPEEIEELNHREQSIIFGQLGSFTMHMLSVGVSVDEARKFLSKQALINDVPDEQLAALNANLEVLDVTLREQESQLLKHQTKEETDDKDVFSLIKEIIKDEKEKLERKKKALKKKEDLLDAHVANYSDTSEWMKSYYDKEQDRIRDQFNEIREILRLKEAEMLTLVKKKQQEMTSGLAAKVADMKKMKDGAVQSHETILKIMSSKDENLLEAIKTNESRIDSHLEVPIDLTKENQVLLCDYDNHVNTTRLRHSLSEISLSEKLSVVRWKVVCMSQQLATAEREYSSVFKLFGFHWKLILFPNGQPSDPRHLGLFLEFNDANNAKNWNLHVKFTIRILNQRKLGEYHQIGDISFEFNDSSTRAGYSNFIELKDFRDESLGWKENDSAIFEVAMRHAIVSDAEDIGRF